MSYSEKFLVATSIFTVMGAALIGGSTSGRAEEVWSFPVSQQVPPAMDAVNPKNIPFTYTPLAHASKPWRICVSHPDIADPYHLALNYGYIQEAKRLGVEVTAFQAGGYDKLPVQISQIEDCVNRGTDAVIIAAISGIGLAGLVNDLSQKGIPVIDMADGIPSPKVTAHVLAPFKIEGAMIGQYLAKHHPAGSPEATLILHPGPAGSGWAEDTVAGFTQGIRGSALKVLAIKYAGTDEPSQLSLVEDEFVTYPKINYFVGVEAGVEAAATAEEEGGHPGILNISTYQTPQVVDMVQNGSASATLVDNTVYQAKIALDEAVRVLEHKPYYQHINVTPAIIDRSNIKAWDRTTSLAPSSWRPVFHYSPKSGT